MKKVYSKPQIYFDSFELSQSIATGCTYDVNDATEKWAFTSEYSCLYEVTEEQCYHVSADNLQAFNS